MITGRCLCGAVRYTLGDQPIAGRACWCRDCQYLASGNAALGLICASASLTVSGETASFSSPADSGTLMTRRFCPVCGTPLFSEAANAPGYLVIRTGTLDDREIGRPESVIWTDSAPRWACIDPGLPHSPRQP